MPCQPVGQRTKCHTKKCLEFEKNDVGCMNFVWRTTCQPATSCVLPILESQCYMFVT